MASTNPSISGNTLTTHGVHTRWGAPRLRMTTSSLPSTAGAFVQRFGLGEAILTGRGVLKKTSEALLNSGIRTIQNDINHAPATYTDADGSTHDNCILAGYERVGDIKKEAADSWWCDVRFAVFKQQAD